MHILVCGGTGCRASASKNIIYQLEECLKEKDLDNDVQVIATGCFGFCEKGPIVKIMPDNTFYVQVKPEDAEEIVNEHIIKGRKIERLLYKDPEKKAAVSDSKHMEFYKKQLRMPHGNDPGGSHRRNQTLRATRQGRWRFPHGAEMAVRPQLPG